MAKVEIEEADLLSLQHVKGVVESVMAVPEARTQFLQLAKKSNPKLSIPEVDAAAPVYAAVNGINSKMAELIESNKQAEAARDAKLAEFLASQEAARLAAEETSRIQAAQRTWEQQKEDLRKQGWRQSGLDQVTQFAETHGIADLTIAADAFERRNPQPGPAESRPGWNLFQQPEQEDTFVKDQMGAQGNDDARLDREIAQTLAEIRAGY